MTETTKGSDYLDNIENYEPLHDRVIVQEIAPSTKTKGGLFVPSGSKDERSVRGIVLAAGPGAFSSDGVFRPTTAQAGQTVIYGKYAGTELEVGNDKIRVVRDTDIYCRVNNPSS